MRTPDRAFGFSSWLQSLGSAKLFPFWNPCFWLLCCLPSSTAVYSFWCLCPVLKCLDWDRWSSWDMCGHGLGKYISICFNRIETTSKKCEFGIFVWEEQNGMSVSSKLGQHAAVMDGLVQQGHRERCLCLGSHMLEMWATPLCVRFNSGLYSQW